VQLVGSGQRVHGAQLSSALRQLHQQHTYASTVGTAVERPNESHDSRTFVVESNGVCAQPDLCANSYPTHVCRLVRWRCVGGL
jgi:hypothetical protein